MKKIIHPFSFVRTSISLIMVTLVCTSCTDLRGSIVQKNTGQQRSSSASSGPLEPFSLLQDIAPSHAWGPYRATKNSDDLQIPAVLLEDQHDRVYPKGSLDVLTRTLTLKKIDLASTLFSRHEAVNAVITGGGWTEEPRWSKKSIDHTSRGYWSHSSEGIVVLFLETSEGNCQGKAIASDNCHDWRMTVTLVEPIAKESK